MLIKNLDFLQFTTVCLSCFFENRVKGGVASRLNEALFSIAAIGEKSLKLTCRLDG